MSEKTIEQIKSDFIDLISEFDGERKAEFIEKFPHIWDDCYDIMEGSRYHRVMQNCFIEGFSEAIQLCEQRERDLVEAIDSLANKLGQDILSVEHETVWGDPNNVKITLELTEDLRKRLFKSLKNLVKLYGKKKE